MGWRLASRAICPVIAPLAQLLDRLLLLQWQKHVSWSGESRFQLNRADEPTTEDRDNLMNPWTYISTGDCSSWWRLCDEDLLPPPLTPTDLWTALEDTRRQLPPALLQTLIESIPRRVAALLRARWGPTRY
ncbi:hypothetical protein TNCV_4248471 [Trichonephila clavipes]|nr:hypothetical protein TNCV_4248471 [Trichonephila clavipes]